MDLGGNAILVNDRRQDMLTDIGQRLVQVYEFDLLDHGT